jgi:predicted PhzF superfamily epimerase YddE/YHI9
MKLPLYQLDAFTSRLFGGNPAAVVVLDAWLPERVLAAIVSAPGDTVDFAKSIL